MLDTYTAMKKRNLFDELMEGLDALQAEREGKITLKRVSLQQFVTPEIKPDEILKLREARHLSRPVFAHAIRTNPRTVESWEQGRSKPNPHAVLLMKLVEKFPETLEHLRAI
jgi:putative transcriptional regulator